MSNWILYGLSAAVFYAGVILIYKKLLVSGLNPLVLNFFVFGITFLGFTIWIFTFKPTINLTYTIVLLLIIAAIFSLIGNFLDVTAVKEAPNPGYAATLKSTQIVLITLLAPLIFKSEFTWLKFSGVILVLLGIFLLSSK